MHNIQPAGSETPSFAALIGIDWADEKHDIQLLATGASQMEGSVIGNTPEAIQTWVQGIQQRFGGRPVAICLEQTRGPLVYALMEYAFITLFPINPYQAATYRKTFAPSGAKDDPVDAALLLDLLCRHREKLTPWRPDDVLTRKIRGLSEERRQSVNLRTQCVQRLTAKLKAYFPQMLAWFGNDLTATMACDFLLQWPSVLDAQKAKPAKLRAFFYGHNSRSEALIKERLEAIAKALPLTTDEGVVAPAVLSVQSLARMIRDLGATIALFDQQIAEAFNQHPDAQIFKSFPGAGKVLAPRLAAVYGTDRTHWPHAELLASFAGIAPVTERSGKSTWVHRRWQCPKFFLQTFFEMAHHSIPYSSWARAYYQHEMAHGKKHNSVVRALAFKWIRIITACWQQHQPYDEATYIQALIKRGSPLAKLITA